jgi:hypothetical protein
VKKISAAWLLALIATSLAVAQTLPLIGTKTSFLDGAYCQKHQCEYVGKIPLSANLSEFRYRIHTQREEIEGFSLWLIVSVFRQGNTVNGVGLRVSGADSPFGSDSKTDLENLKIPLDLVLTATGVKIDDKAFLDLQRNCDRKTLILKNLSRSFTLACATSGDSFDAQTWNYRLYESK